MPNLILFLLIPILSACALASSIAVRCSRKQRAWVTETLLQAEAIRREREMHRQTLRAVTGGRLVLCEPGEIRALLTGERVWTLPLLEAGDVPLFRQHLREIAGRRGFSNGRLDDLCSCVSEAAGNAILHSQGGVAQVWAEEDSLTILVSDCGRGIAPEALFPLESESRALETLGFRLMLAMSDTLALSTGADGTQILLKIRNDGIVPEETTEEKIWGVEELRVQAA